MYVTSHSKIEDVRPDDSAQKRAQRRARRCTFPYQKRCTAAAAKDKRSGQIDKDHRPTDRPPAVPSLGSTQPGDDEDAELEED